MIDPAPLIIKDPKRDVYAYAYKARQQQRYRITITYYIAGP